MCMYVVWRGISSVLSTSLSICDVPRLDIEVLISLIWTPPGRADLDTVGFPFPNFDADDFRLLCT